MKKILITLGVIAVLIMGGPMTSTFASSPAAGAPDGDVLAAAPLVATAESAIIIDHTTTDLSQIPAYWIEQAKELAIHYAHTSHGSQVRAYLPGLEALDSLYDFSAFYAGSSPPSSLSSCEADALCMYDGNPPETYITPEDYWETVGGIGRTQAVADTGLFGFSMWSWCGQASYYSDAQIQQYLDQMAQFESEYPNMRFILMTGHTDGGSESLTRHNNMIRQFALDNKMVLFDFADIESYDPDGNYYPNTTDACDWCSDWCAAHPEDCQDLPDCAHSHGFNCKLKGYAFWWMMARLAGWNGITLEPDLSPSTKTASQVVVDFGNTITYTIKIENATGALTNTVQMSDTLPSGLAYVSGTLKATSGSVNDASAPDLSWTGVLTPTPSVTITYAVTVTVAGPQGITNTAIFTIPGYDPLTRSATIVANGEEVYLPLVVR